MVVRPLVAVDADGSGRNIKQCIVLLNHEQRDGLKGFTTITGGKLMTYRLMAEWATDLLAKKLGNTQSCQTHLRPLPGSQQATKALKRLPVSPNRFMNPSFIATVNVPRTFSRRCEKPSGDQRVRNGHRQ